MKKVAVILTLGALLSASAAYADDAGMMHDAFANTVVVTEASGAVYRYHFNADNSFDVVAPGAQNITGTYQISGGQICITYTGRTQAACTAYAGEKHVGDTWTQTGSDGAAISVALVAGRP
jgi:hypothetical protein